MRCDAMLCGAGGAPIPSTQPWRRRWRRAATSGSACRWGSKLRAASSASPRLCSLRGRPRTRRRTSEGRSCRCRRSLSSRASRMHTPCPCFRLPSQPILLRFGLYSVSSLELFAHVSLLSSQLLRLPSQFPVAMPHSIREWPYAEWDALHARLTLQARALCPSSVLPPPRPLARLWLSIGRHSRSAAANGGWSTTDARESRTP